jgi:hypothetical protein
MSICIRISVRINAELPTQCLSPLFSDLLLVRKSVTQKHFPRKGTADFVQEPLFALTKSGDVGEQEFSGQRYA